MCQQAFAKKTVKITVNTREYGNVYVTVAFVFLFQFCLYKHKHVNIILTDYQRRTWNSVSLSQATENCTDWRN